MDQRRRAFTLIELLVVIAIIAILAAILFPVFAQAKEAAKKTADLSNMKQHALSVQMYSGDSDDVAPLWMYYGSDFNVSTSGDRSWGNLVFPYIKADELSKTPNSPFSVQSRKYNPNFPSPNSVGAMKRDQELYNLGWLTDYGYNYIAFTGFGTGPASQGGISFSPISMTTPASPAGTILLITGDFNRDGGGGVQDGGQLPIDEPCLYDSSFNGLWAGNLAYYYGGWQPSSPNAWNVFGGAWPYYGGKGTSTGARMSVGFADGHAKTMTVPQVADGCNVKDGSVGTAYDLNRYLWDTRA
jgi:prepilin-type N-terminal cleavage/methylation domain-containing protein